MGFKRHDKQTFIVDTAKEFASRRITKREFLKKMGMAGIGFSAFNAGLLGSTRPFHGGSLIGDPAFAADDEMTKWLKDCLLYTSDAADD